MTSPLGPRTSQAPKTAAQASESARPMRLLAAFPADPRRKEVRFTAALQKLNQSPQVNVIKWLTTQDAAFAQVVSSWLQEKSPDAKKLFEQTRGAQPSALLRLTLEGLLVAGSRRGLTKLLRSYKAAPDIVLAESTRRYHAQGHAAFVRLAEALPGMGAVLKLLEDQVTKQNLAEIFKDDASQNLLATVGHALLVCYAEDGLQSVRAFVEQVAIGYDGQFEHGSLARAYGPFSQKPSLCAAWQQVPTLPAAVPLPEKNGHTRPKKSPALGLGLPAPGPEDGAARQTATAHGSNGAASRGPGSLSPPWLLPSEFLPSAPEDVFAAAFADTFANASPAAADTPQLEDFFAPGPLPGAFVGLGALPELAPLPPLAQPQPLRAAEPTGAQAAAEFSWAELFDAVPLAGVGSQATPPWVPVAASPAALTPSTGHFAAATDTSQANAPPAGAESVQSLARGVVAAMAGAIVARFGAEHAAWAFSTGEIILQSSLQQERALKRARPEPAADAGVGEEFPAAKRTR